MTPVETTPAAALDAVSKLWRGVGADVREMTPADHDRALAWTSHLGHVLSYALAHSLGEAGGDSLALAGPSLRELTRMAGGSTPMWRDIFLANDRAVLAAIDDFTGSLEQVRASIESGDEAALDALLDLGLATRRRIEDDT